MEPNVNVSLFVEIPEVLHETLTTFLDTRPDWDQDRVFSAALALFLLQNRPANERKNDRDTARIYLDSIFKRPAEFLVATEPSEDAIPLKELKLSKRPHNCLTRVGVATIQQLEKMRDEELLEISNFGAGCLAEVREAVLRFRSIQALKEVGVNSQIPITEIKPYISTMAYHGLLRSGIRTIEDLEQKSEADLLKISNFGDKCLQEVKTALSLHYRVQQTIVSQSG